MKLDNKLLKEMIAEALEEIKVDPRGHRGAYEQAKKSTTTDQNQDEKDKKTRKDNQADTSELPDWMVKGELAEEISPEVADLEARAAKEEQEAAAATEEVTAAKAKQAQKEADEAAKKAGATMEESFQLTKGRLRQIIREELISAKKQGLL